MRKEFQASTRKHQNCVVFTTHKLDEGVLSYLAYLKKEVEGTMDFVVLYDQSAHPIREEDYPDYSFFFFESEKLRGFFHQGNKLLPNTFVALIEYAKQYRYDHYLLMENDIILQGKFHEFIGRVCEEQADYIHIATDVEGGPLNHWPVQYIRDCPFERLYFAWCHIFYVSRKFIVDVAKFMDQNDSIHYEFLLPTMAYAGGYEVRQFENFGYHFQVSWGPVAYYEFLHRIEQTHNTFYHPFKHLELLAFENL